MTIRNGPTSIARLQKRKVLVLLLREHPLLRYWPPVWAWIGGGSGNRPRGGICILRRGVTSNLFPDKCYLYIEYQESSYFGCLLFTDLALAPHIFTPLLCYCNRTIVEIGSLDITHLL